MNNKGFMMAEVVVVSAVVLVTLTGLYLSYNKILSIYNQRVNYFDTTALYRLAYIRDTNYEDIITNKTPDWNSITNGTETLEKVYYVDKNLLTNGIPNSIGSVNKTFTDYVEYLKDSIESETQNILIMEKCQTKDNCKYAFLEVYEQ